MEFKKFTENDLVKCTKTFIEIFNDEPWNDKWTVERAEHYLSDYYHTPGFTGVLAMEENEIVGFIYGVRLRYALSLLPCLNRTVFFF